MTNFDNLSVLLERNHDPVIADYADRVIGVLATAIKLAMGGVTEDLELLVISAQDFAGERGEVHLADRTATAGAEVRDLMKKL